MHWSPSTSFWEALIGYRAETFSLNFTAKIEGVTIVLKATTKSLCSVQSRQGQKQWCLPVLAFPANHAWPFSRPYSLWNKSGTWWSDALSTHQKLFFFFSFSSQLNAVERQRSTLYNAVLTSPISDNCYLQLFVYLTVFQHKQHQLTFPQNTSSTDDPPSLHCNSPVSRKEGMRTCPVLLKRFFFLTAWKNKNESGLPMRAEMK